MNNSHAYAHIVQNRAIWNSSNGQARCARKELTYPSIFCPLEIKSMPGTRWNRADTIVESKH